MAVKFSQFIAEALSSPSFLVGYNSSTSQNTQVSYADLVTAFSPGTGTVNYVAKWTGASVLGNSQIFDNGTNVGIGTASVNSSLEIYKASGNSYIYLTNGTSGTNNGVVLRFNNIDYMGMIGTFTSGELKVGGFNAGGYFMTFYSNNSERMRLTPSGRLLLGTTTESTYLLDVNGTARVSGTELRLDNGTTGVINLYSTTPEIRFSVGDPTNYRFYRSGTNMIMNSAGAIIQQIAGNDAYTLNASSGHIWRTALSGGAALARLTTGGNFMIGTTTDAGYRLDVNGSMRGGGIISETTGGYVELRTAIATALRVRNTSGGIWLEGSEINSIPTTIMTVATSGLPQNYILLGGGTGSGANSTRINTNNGYGYNWGLNIGADGTRVMQIFTGGNVTFEKNVSNTSTNNSSALVTLNSTTQGFLPPRMTNAQMVAIATPAAGLVVYDTTNNKLNVYDGTAWIAVH